MKLIGQWEGLLDLIRGVTWRQSESGFVLDLSVVLLRDEKGKADLRLMFPGATKLTNSTGMNYPGANAEELFERVSKDLKL
jgi:hypothetical protein